MESYINGEEIMIYPKEIWQSELWKRYYYALINDDIVSAVNFLSRIIEAANKED